MVSLTVLLHRVRRAAPFCFLALVTLAATAAAQTTTSRASIDLTAANSRFGNNYSGTSFAASPAFHAEAPKSVFDAGATFSTLAGNWSIQGGASASLFTPRAGSHWMGEGAGSAGGTGHQDGTKTSVISAIARLHFLGARKGLWAGAGGGWASDGLVSRNITQGEAGAWASIPNGTVSAFISPTRMGPGINFTDAEATMHLFQDKAGLDASAGFRTGSSLPITGGDQKVWGSVTGTLWMTRSVAAVVSGGTYPVDFGQGFPGGRFISAGIRIGRIPRAEKVDQFFPEQQTLSPDDHLVAARIAAVLTATPLGRGQARLTVSAPAARKVEIMGDFTDWSPMALSRTLDGEWTMTVPMAPGIHEINYRIDGGGWQVPPGLDTRKDEFGGSVGILVVGK